jgi:hypothetical protein
MAAAHSHRTQVRFALLFFALLVQLILLAALLPATRSIAITLAGTMTNAVLGTLCYFWMARKRSLLGGAGVYFLFAVFLATVEIILLGRFVRIVRDVHVAMIPTGIFYPMILPMMLWIVQRCGQPTKTQTELGEKEKLRNRNGY